jgi:hypothetical protein
MKVEKGMRMLELIKQIASPLSRKLATTLGGVLTGIGASNDDVSAITAALPVVIGLIIDVAASALREAQK